MRCASWSWRGHATTATMHQQWQKNVIAVIKFIFLFVSLRCPHAINASAWCDHRRHNDQPNYTKLIVIPPDECTASFIHSHSIRTPNFTCKIGLITSLSLSQLWQLWQVTWKENNSNLWHRIPPFFLRFIYLYFRAKFIFLAVTLEFMRPHTACSARTSIVRHPKYPNIDAQQRRRNSFQYLLRVLRRFPQRFNSLERQFKWWRAARRVFDDTCTNWLP